MNSIYEDNSKILKALGDPNRLKILDLLSCGEKCACEILESFKFTQPTLSHHMKVLENYGLILVQKRGKWHYYSLNPKKSTVIINGLTEILSDSKQCICKDAEEDC